MAPSIEHPSAFSFPDDNLSTYQWTVTKLGTVFALIFWRSGLRLLVGKYRQFLTELSARHTSVFLFPGDKLSEYE